MSTVAQEYRWRRLAGLAGSVGWLTLVVGSFVFDGTGWGYQCARWALIPLMFTLYQVAAQRVLGRVLRGELTTAVPATTPTEEP